LKIYDITQELFGCRIYPGDPAPKREVLSSMDEGALYNLTALSLCAHNGTHLDAPSHFLKEGDSIDKLPLEKTVGRCFVASCAGVLSGEDAAEILRKAERALQERPKRLLLKGETEVSLDAARVFASFGLSLLGNESQTVGPKDTPMAVHLSLLSAGTLLLEGVVLEAVPEGVYFLSAAPLLLGGAEGAPVRAYLIEEYRDNEIPR
jgi:arylformamidase